MTNPLHDALLGRRARDAAPFLHLPDRTVVSYAAFAGLVARYAHAIAGCGLAPGDRLAAQVAKSPEALALDAACVQAGVVLLPINPACTADEVGYFVGDSAASLLVCDPADAAALGPLAHGAGARIETLGADGAGTLADLAARRPAAFPTAPRDGSDLAALLYTSGTTGRAKGAMLTHDNLLSNALALTELWRFSADDVLLHALPIFHTHGLFVATNVTLAAGASMILLPGFEPDAVFAALPKATALMGVPTFYTRLLDDPRLTREATAHMRLFVSGSAPLLAATHETFAARTGHRILERYGMTETGMIASNPYDGERRPGAVGFALPGVEVRITDARTGAIAPCGGTGRVEVRGPNVFKGYWRMPDKTAADMRDDGFFVTGDLGRVDDDGYLSIVGRDKDLIISGGLNVYPKEVELALDAQPGVLESAVIGVPHPDLGETVVAVVVARPGETPDLDDVAAGAGAKLARYKQPRRLIRIDSLPRNTMGKVQKNVLRDRFAGLFTGDAAR